MRCRICDKALSDAEIQTAPDGSSEPCTPCMEIVLDAAYSDGFVRPDDLADEVETLDDETFMSELDELDTWVSRDPSGY